MSNPVNAQKVSGTNNLVGKLNNIALPTVNVPEAGSRVVTFDGGFDPDHNAGDDVTWFGYNLSSTIWEPNDPAEAMAYYGVESRYFNPNHAFADTSEAYLRFTPPNNMEPPGFGYSEAFFFNYDRVNKFVLFGHMAADTLILDHSSTGDKYLSADSGGVTLGLDNPKVSIGPLSADTAVNFGINTDNPLFELNAQIDTNPVRLRLVNVGGTVLAGLAGSVGNEIFAGDVPYAFGINNGIGTRINFGHTTVQMALLASGRVGIGNTTPLSMLALTGASSANDSIFEVTTGTGLNEDNKLQVGVHDGDYCWFQSIQPGVAYHDLVLQRDGGRLGIGTAAPDTTLHVNGVAKATGVQVGATSQIAGVRTAVGTLDFGSISAGASADLTINVSGAAVGDTVALGLPAAPTAGIVFNGFVSSAGVVTVRASNITGSPIDPASDSYRATVIQF